MVTNHLDAKIMRKGKKVLMHSRKKTKENNATGSIACTLVANDPECNPDLYAEGHCMQDPYAVTTF